MSEKAGTKASDELHPSLAEAYLGVWRIVYTRVSPFELPGGHSIEDWKRGYRYLRTCVYPFFVDAQRLFGPWLFSLYILNHLWSGIEGALLLYLLNELLKQVFSILLSLSVSHFVVLNSRLNSHTFVGHPMYGRSGAYSRCGFFVLLLSHSSDGSCLSLQQRSFRNLTSLQ